jgi:hypothetical protein
MKMSLLRSTNKSFRVLFCECDLERLLMMLQYLLMCSNDSLCILAKHVTNL